MSESSTSDVIVVGIDGSDGARRALRWGLGEAQRRRCAVEVVTAWPVSSAPTGEPADPEEARRQADELQRHLVDSVVREQDQSVSIAYEVVSGDPAEALVRASSRAQLLVIGSHGVSSMRHAVLGSVSEACGRLAACPVVILPAAALEHERGHSDELMAR